MDDTTDKIIVKRLQEWEIVMAKLERYYNRTGKTFLQSNKSIVTLTE